MALDSKYGQVTVPGIPDDEPIFILRAQDATAISTIEDYIRNNDGRKWVQDDLREFHMDFGDDKKEELPEDFLSNLPGRDAEGPSKEWRDSFEEKVFPAFLKWQYENHAKVKFAD